MAQSTSHTCRKPPGSRILYSVCIVCMFTRMKKLISLYAWAAGMDLSRRELKMICNEFASE